MSTVQTLDGSMQTQEPSSGDRRGPSGLTQAGRFAGAIGAVLLVSTPLTWLLTGEVGPLVWGKCLVAGLLLAMYFATNSDFFGRFAGSRSTGLLTLSALSVLLVMGLVGAANYVAFKNPKEFDFTRDQLYTLSQQTQDLLGRLQGEVRVMAFYASYERPFPQVQELLERYDRLSDKLTVEMIDPQSRPDLVDKFQITERGPRIVVAANGQEARAREPDEQSVTNAIMKAAEQNAKTLYFLTGHGEGDIADGDTAEGFKAFADALQAEGYVLKPLNLIQPEVAEDAAVAMEADADDEPAGLSIPADADVVIVLAPRQGLLPPEAEALSTYADKGGRLVVFAEPNRTLGLEAMLRRWRMELRQDLVVDTNPLNRLLGLGPAAPLAQPLVEDGHPLTEGMAAPVVMMTARSMSVIPGGNGVDTQPVLQAGETAWGETQLQDGSASRDDQDNLGPVALALAGEKSLSGEEAADSAKARVVAFGDSEWINNRYLNMQGNADLALNAIHWVAAQEGKITVRPKKRASTQLFLSGEQLGRLKFFSMDILPVFLVALGLGIVMYRRQR